jgi:hypothetical protein
VSIFATPLIILTYAMGAGREGARQVSSPPLDYWKKIKIENINIPNTRINTED